MDVETKKEAVLEKDLAKEDNKVFKMMLEVKSTDTFKLYKRIEALLKKELKFQEKYSLLKSGCGKQTVPDNPNWMYLRSVGILKRCHKNPLGVLKIRKIYGGLTNRGSKPDKKRLASGKLTRVIQQKLEQAGLLSQVKGGRITTKKGELLLLKGLDSE